MRKVMEDQNSVRGRERVEWIVKVEVEVGAALRVDAVSKTRQFARVRVHGVT